MALSSTPGVRHFRRPWYWLVVLALVALCATILVIGNAYARYAQDVRGFEASQELRAQRTEQRIDDYFGEAIQLASFGAETLDYSRGDLPLTRTLIAAILRSHRRPEIYGVGVFYARYAFDPRFQYAMIYDLNGPHGVRELVHVTDHVGSNHYLDLAWFRRAASVPGQTAFSGPYTHMQSFISTERAFFSNRRLVGVMIVDTLTTRFKALMASALGPGDVAWVESSRGGGRKLVATAVMPPGVRVDRRITLRYTGAFLHVSSDAIPLRAAARDEFSTSIGLIAAIWLAAGLIALGMIQRWSAQERQQALEVEQARLEDEIALAKTVEHELRRAAYTDVLTGLPNRLAFLEFTEAILRSPERDRYAVFFIDLDRFNIVNETLGHSAGDDLLCAIGKRLETLVEGSDLVARLGGDEFVMVAAVGQRSFTEAASLLLAHLSEPISVRGRTIYPEASVGVVAIEDGYKIPEDLLRDADIAMYAAKERGRAQFAVFDAAMRRRVATESQLDDDLRRAIDRGELLPYYQPIVSVVTGRIVAFEALVRWRHSDGTTLETAEFMRFAETHGYVEAIDRLVFRAVCVDAETIFSSFPSAVISINVSVAELANHHLVRTIQPLMQQHGLRPAQIKLEITETAMMTSSEIVFHAIEKLRRLGLEFVLDDFGTGYSSLAYLQRLPIAGIKIDQSFVQSLTTDPKALEIVRSIVALARSFGLSTTAEGVETREQWELLASLEVDHAQGFFFSPAVEIEALARLRDLTASA